MIEAQVEPACEEGDKVNLTVREGTKPACEGDRKEPSVSSAVS